MKSLAEKYTTVILMLLISVSVCSKLGQIAQADTGELAALPAGSRLQDPFDLRFDRTRLLIEVDIKGMGQVAYVKPGEIVLGTCRYQIYSGAGNPSEISQGFFILSWTQGWPPSEGFYIPIYNGIAGVYPGVTKTASFSFNAPTVPGTYYLYWCGGAHYSMKQAVNCYNQPLSLPAHAKIVVMDTPDPHNETPTSLWIYALFTVAIAIAVAGIAIGLGLSKRRTIAQPSIQHLTKTTLATKTAGLKKPSGGIEGNARN